MNHLEHHLLQNEHILHRSMAHWVVFVSPAIWVFITMVLTYQNTIVALLAYMTGLISVINLINALITYNMSEYAITNKRVLVKTGFFSHSFLEVLLPRVESIQVSQGLLGRLFNYGTIVIRGFSGAKDPFRFLDQPIGFHHCVQEQIEKSKTQ